MDFLAAVRGSAFMKRAFVQRILKHGRLYWLSALAVMAIGVFVDGALEASPDILSLRYWLFRQVTNFEWRAHIPRFTKTVLIRDDEYWSDLLDGRRPIRRDYLALMMSDLDHANVASIALDFDVGLRAKGADGAPGHYESISPAYRAETDTLMRTIAAVAVHRQVVLPKLVWFGSPYRLLPDIFGPYGICIGPNAKGEWENPGTREFPLVPAERANISCGYINLPYDLALIPPRIDIGGGTKVPSFAFALAEAVDPDIAASVSQGEYYGSYLSASSFEDSHAVVSARDLREGNADVVKLLKHKAVLVGGGWDTEGEGRGAAVDMHFTPLGPMQGTLIHQNFTEAILDGRHYASLPESLLTTFEILFSIASIVVFAGFSSFWGRFAGLAGMSLALLVIQFMMLVTVGTFFDAFFPLFALWSHSAIDRVIESRGHGGH